MASQRLPRWTGAAVAALVMMLVPVSAVASTGNAAPGAAATPPPCAPPGAQRQPLGPTTVATIEQAYFCIFAHDYYGPTLDDRILLVGAFAGLTAKLSALGLDQANATLPALSGDHQSDWDAFAQIYQAVLTEVPNAPQLHQELAEATMNGMLASLHDNHTGWTYPISPPGFGPTDDYGLGIETSPMAVLANNEPEEAVPPMFVTHVDSGSPASRSHPRIQPGDVVTAIDGVPPFTDGVPNTGVTKLVTQSYPQDQTVQLTLQRPGTGHRWTVVLTPGVYPSPGQPNETVPAKLLGGDIAYVELRWQNFFPGSASSVLKAIARLGKGKTLRGVILDLRGNGGGAVPEMEQLLGAFEHGVPWSYDCTVSGSCSPNYPDDTTPLLHLRLVVLTDRNCASACDAFSAAVKDLHLGMLVGTRTAGVVTGQGAFYFLDDGSVLGLPAKHEIGANKEIINGIGVAPDYEIRLTPQEVAHGQDPDIQKALALLGSEGNPAAQ